MIKTRAKWMWLSLLLGLVALCAGTACHSKPSGPGMILEFGSVIEGRSIDIKSSRMSNGQPFSNPGSVGGVGTSKWGSWDRIPTKVEAASGDDRGLPEWVEFVWQEPSYPGLRFEDFPTHEAFAKAVGEKYAKLPIKNQRLEIKRRVPQDVVDEVIESKRNAPRGEVAEKCLWIFIFWTPEGIKMRWQLRDDPGLKQRNFGDVVREGGDDLDQYNRKPGASGQ